MTIFNLPDLGEGLPDAEISQWHVKVGDTVTTDQPLVSMETAKAVVEVPSPQDGVIKKLYGQNGDIIITGASLLAFETEESNEDQGTVVGNIQSSGEVINDDFIIGGNNERSRTHIKATPKVRSMARKLGVNLSLVSGSGTNNKITLQDIEAAANPLQEGFEPLKGVRRHMVRTMSESHAKVVPVTIFDDAILTGNQSSGG
jgi:pyruvate dehydrogenase E2 component (dihydrolipoamide acetyltransferase)